MKTGAHNDPTESAGRSAAQRASNLATEVGDAEKLLLATVFASKRGEKKEAWVLCGCRLAPHESTKPGPVPVESCRM